MTSLANLTDRERDRLKLRDNANQSLARIRQLWDELDEEEKRLERLRRQLRAMGDEEEIYDEHA